MLLSTTFLRERGHRAIEDQPLEQSAPKVELPIADKQTSYTVQLPYFLDFQYASNQAEVTFADGRVATLIAGADGQVYVRLKR